jgi:acyl-CoA thioester hydrolase
MDDLRTPGPFVHRLRVRYGECDVQGVVFNAHYLAYVDDALTELWRARFGGYAAVTARGVDVVVAESHLRFRASAHFDDELAIRVDAEHLGTTSMTLRNVITRVGEEGVLVEAEMRYVWIDLTTRGKTPIPDWVRAALTTPAAA